MFSALRCSLCSKIFRPSAFEVAGSQGSTRNCPSCRSSSARTIRPVRATADLRGETQDLIRSLKYRNQRGVVADLADRLVTSILADPDSPIFDVVTWAPTSMLRHRQRGYDQSELLAKAVAERLGLRCRRLLYRDRSAPQTGRNRQERLDGPMFRARPLRHPCRVLVIDDVVTTGSTLRAAAHALDLAGASEVCLLAVAATPRDRSTNSRVA
jgi:predicted amidophosphoribosyltransferase